VLLSILLLVLGVGKSGDQFVEISVGVGVCLGK